MGVAILQPEDCLKLPNSVKHRNSFSPNPNRSNRAQQPGRKKRSPITSYPSPPSAVPRVPAKHLVMGQVKILKRGEELKKPTPPKSVTFAKENVVADLDSSKRLGPDLVSAPTQNRLTESTNNNDNKRVISAPTQNRLTESTNNNDNKRVISAPTQNRLTESTNNNDNKRVIPAPFYAGSAFNVTSPPPSSVPMPAFFTKKVVDATSDLRRILRLDL